MPVNALSKLESVKLFFDQYKMKNKTFEKKQQFNKQLESLISLDKKVKLRFDKLKRPIEIVDLKDIYKLLSEHTFFQQFDGHP